MIGSIYLFIYLSQNSRFLLTFFFFFFFSFSLMISFACNFRLYVRPWVSSLSLLTTEALAGTQRDMIGPLGSGLKFNRRLFKVDIDHNFSLLFLNLSNCHYHQERK